LVAIKRLTNTGETKMFNEDAIYEANAAYDYKVEAYGDRCPGCGTLRWGGDCVCNLRAEMEAENEAMAAELVDFVPAADFVPVIADSATADDDILF
jgi:hypothetical protein